MSTIVSEKPQIVPSKKNLLVSFSGGETSAFMAHWLLQNKSNDYNMVFVFANTGKEREETLQFADRCDKEFGLNLVWVEAIVNPEYGVGIRARIVNFETANRTGAPFEEMMAKYGMVNIANPNCTKYLKARAIEDYARQIGWSGYYTAIGIRNDEIDRQSEAMVKNRLIYPLISMRPTMKPEINFWWSKRPWRLNLKGYEGNCDLCWKKSLRKLLTLIKENPSIVDWWRTMEKKYENFIPKTRDNPNITLPIRFFRGNLSIEDLVRMSKESFNPAKDDSVNYSQQQSLFGHQLDVSNGCSESCEVF